VQWDRLRDQSIVALVAVVLAAVAIWLIGHIIGIAALVAIAVVCALALEPLMVRAERYMPRLLAAAAVYIVVLGSLGVLGFFFIPPLFHQAVSLAAQVPGYVAAADVYATEQAARVGVRLPPGTVSGMLSRIQDSITNGGSSTNLALAVIGLAEHVGEAMADIVLVLVLAFYFMVDGRRMRAGVASLFPTQQRPKVRFVEETISSVLGAYVRSQLIMAALMAISAGIGCWLLGVPYPAVIGTLAFLAELVPLVGPFLAAIPAMVIAVFHSFGLMVEVTFFFVIMQMAENNVIRPRITGPMVGLHPIEALLALVVGAATAGFWGALFAVPAVGIAVVFLTVIFKAWRGEPLEFQRRGMRVRLIVPDEDKPAPGQGHPPPSAGPARPG
jgi:predicted PurR-regulated permease PerM